MGHMPYHQLARNSAFVRLLEIECCSMAHGWLDAMLAPVLDDAG